MHASSVIIYLIIGIYSDKELIWFLSNFSGGCDIMKYIMENEPFLLAKLDVKNKNGDTILIDIYKVATMLQRRIDFDICCVVRWGANVTIKDSSNKTIMDYAGGCSRFCDMLVVEANESKFNLVFIISKMCFFNVICDKYTHQLLYGCLNLNLNP